MQTQHTEIGLVKLGRKLGAYAGKPISRTSLLRWIKRGVVGRNGQRIRLNAIRVGGRWAASHDAIATFMAAINCEELEPAT